MKAKELKKYLEQLSKSDLTNMTLDLYKMLPKAKRQDFQLNLLLASATTNEKSKKKLSLEIEALKIEQFARNAHLQNYLYPNDVVATKARRNWSNLVRKWFKNLSNTARQGADYHQQASLLEELYLLLCDACQQEYFLCDDPFQAIKITQVDFYKTTLLLWQEAEGKGLVVQKGIELMIFNPLNNYTLYSQLMVIYLEFLDASDLQRKAIDYALAILVENGFTVTRKEGAILEQPSLSTEDYWHEEVHNNLVELIYRLYTQLGDLEKAIEFFKGNYYERKNEIRLYVLVRLLFEAGNHERIRYEIERATKCGIQPRESLLTLLDCINSEGNLPQYL